MTNSQLPSGATHKENFYGRTTYYRMIHGLWLNNIAEVWQNTTIWHVWDNKTWVDPGAGWSNRRLQPIE